MRSAAQYRAQAGVYRQVARILSNPQDAEIAEAAADRFAARAEQLEARQRRERNPATTRKANSR
jgi:hypothetical protein